jgi:hypothetical protein
VKNSGKRDRCACLRRARLRAAASLKVLRG